MTLPRNSNCKLFVNVVDFIGMRETRGKSSLEISGIISERTHNINDVQIKEMFTLVKKIENLSFSRTLYTTEKEVLEIFSELKYEIEEADRRETDDTSEGLSSKWINLFTLLGGIKALQRFVMSFSELPADAALAYESEHILQLQGIALEIIHAICISFESVSKTLGGQKDFLECLFTYLQFHETCFPACKLIECLLLSREEMLDLSSIKNLKELVADLEDLCLGNFCKILAITLSDLDMYENKTSLYAQTKQKKGQNFYVRDKNQDVVLAFPDILQRLVKIACAKPYVPYFPSAGPETEQWLQWIDSQISSVIQTPGGGGNPFIAGVTKWSEESIYGPPQTSKQVTLELTIRADSVCVLGLLLVGRHRKDVQKKLAELRLVPRLSELFDYFVWKANSREFVRLPGHNNSCECSPEVALKIQVLRLVHSFCDHSSFKRVMLSWAEYSELQALEDGPSTSDPTKLPSMAMCDGSKGLLTKIVDVLKKESGISTFRFWLSRAIESYLRGSVSSADQNFLIRRNLLQLIVGSLISSNTRNKEVLQSSFDLLGEMIKFNFSAFQQLNKCLNTSAKQRKLFSLMNSSLVDSNMFIRSLVLSYESFVSSNDEAIIDFIEKQCCVSRHINTVKLRVGYLQKLLALINIQNLTQENVSCLNTALVILMFGERRKELPEYLRSLAANQESCSLAASDQGTSTLVNLRDLLLFWKEHYLQKDKDCTILEKSSRICFHKWQETVALLTRDCDPPDPCTILYYTVPAVSSRAC